MTYTTYCGIIVLTKQHNHIHTPPFPLMKAHRQPDQLFRWAFLVICEVLFMLKRICPHCGRTYSVGSACDCAQSKRKKKEQRRAYDQYNRNKDAASFYHSTNWEKLSDAVRRRSSYADTLQSYLAILIRRGMLLHYVQNQQTDAGRAIVKTLVSLLVSDSGVPVQFQTKRVRLVVHHVVPRDDDKSREFDPDNLIALLPVVHNLVHDYYDASQADKEAMQRILFDAVNYFK